MGGKKDVDLAVAAAKKAFESFSMTPKDVRLKYLKKLRSITLNRFDELAEAISTEMGAPITMAKEAQADAAIGHLDGFISALESFEETIESLEESIDKSLGKHSISSLLIEPLGGAPISSVLIEVSCDQQ